MAYRSQVREAVDQLIQTAPLALPIAWNHPWWAIVMCIEHERIHLETSSVLIRQHALEYVKPHPAWQPCRKSGDAPQNQLVQIPAGDVRLGKEIRLGNLQIPLDDENRMGISYVGEPGTFPYYSFYDVINDKVQAGAFKNKIVLVGFTASGLGSLYVAPVAHNFPGVETIANVVQNMLHKNFIV